MLSASFAQNWRLELFFKSPSELKLLVPFLQRNNVQRVNLTNKDKSDDLAGWKRVLTSHIQGIHVCTHYSIKNNYHGGSKGAHEAWVQFCEAHASGSILLVSGGGKKKAYDAIDALKGLPHQTAERVDIHVAFNPYLASKEEEQRMTAKLATGRVSGVWLQTGSNLEHLQAGLTFLKSAVSASPNPSAKVYGSVFIPNKQLLAQMKYRPWNGVFLSDEYLSSVEAAERVTTQILKVYNDNGIIPLIETRVETDEQLKHALALLASGCGGGQAEVAQKKGGTTNITAAKAGPRDTGAPDMVVSGRQRKAPRTWSPPVA